LKPFGQPKVDGFVPRPVHRDVPAGMKAGTGTLAPYGSAMQNRRVLAMPRSWNPPIRFPLSRQVKFEVKRVRLSYCVRGLYVKRGTLS
jgi:hypothetical protein